MGTDIHGWVEYYHQDIGRWKALMKLTPLVSDRNYELFAWLFGVGRRQDIPMRWDYPPVAADRGLPPDASADASDDYAAALAQYPGEFHSVTWVTWHEVQAIDWDESIEDQIVESRHSPQGERTLFGTYIWRTQFITKHAALLPGGPDALVPGRRWTMGDKDFEVLAMRRRDVLEEPWQLLFRLMGTLIGHGLESEHLRLIVWFDG